MTSDRFADWLQGFFELSEADSLTEKQVQIIKDHLALVFTKVTPDRSDPGLGIDPMITIPPTQPYISPSVDPMFNPNRVYCENGLVNISGANASDDTLFCAKINDSNYTDTPGHEGVTCNDAVETIIGGHGVANTNTTSIHKQDFPTYSGPQT